MKLLEPWLKSHDFSHLHYRKKTANNACNPVLDVTPSRDEIERRISAVAAGHRRRPVVVLGIDGAFVPTRPDSARQHRPGRRGKRAKRALWRGQWRDAKGFRFYLLDGDRIVHLLSWHQVHNEEQLGVPGASGGKCMVREERATNHSIFRCENSGLEACPSKEQMEHDVRLHGVTIIGWPKTPSHLLWDRH